MRYRQERKKLLWMMVLLALCLTGCGKKAAVYDSAAEETVTEGTTAEAADSEEEEAASVWVYVCGEVRTPGVYELPEGSRITDAVEAAGGMTEGAAGTYLNLAETVSDGQKIEVPSVEMAQTLEEAAAEGTSGLVNLNRPPRPNL